MSVMTSLLEKESYQDFADSSCLQPSSRRTREGDREANQGDSSEAPVELSRHRSSLVSLHNSSNYPLKLHSKSEQAAHGTKSRKKVREGT